MELRKTEAKAIQRGLEKLGLYTKAIDGDLGPNSQTAVNAYLMANANRLPRADLRICTPATTPASLATCAPRSARSWT